MEGEKLYKIDDRHKNTHKMIVKVGKYCWTFHELRP